MLLFLSLFFKEKRKVSREKGEDAEKEWIIDRAILKEWKGWEVQSKAEGPFPLREVGKGEVGKNVEEHVGWG